MLWRNKNVYFLQQGRTDRVLIPDITAPATSKRIQRSKRLLAEAVSKSI